MHSEERFARVLGRKDTLALAFGAMIGWGWVILVGDWITDAGAFGALAGFAIAGAGIGAIALLYAELASAMPQAGGEHVYSMRALGRLGSFVCTWALIFGYVSVVAFEAVALPTVFEYLAPNFKKGYLWTVEGYDVYLSWAALGIGGAIVTTWLNVRGIRMSATFQTTATVVLLVAGATLLTGALTSGFTDNLQPRFTDGMTGIAAVMVAAPFMLVGFDVIPQAAEEINLPRRMLGILIVFSVSMAILWYCMVVLSSAMLLDHDATGDRSLAAVDANIAAWGSAGGTILIVGGIAGIVTSWNAFIIGGSRAIYALAESGMLPSFFGRLHPDYKVPANAILFTGLLSCLSPLFGQPALVTIVNAGGFAITVAYLFVAISFLVLRYKEPAMPRPFRLPAGKFMGWMGISVAAGLCCLYLPGSSSALTDEAWRVIAVWCVLGLLFYRKRGRVDSLS